MTVRNRELETSVFLSSSEIRQSAVCKEIQRGEILGVTGTRTRLIENLQMVGAAGGKQIKRRKLSSLAKEKGRGHSRRDEELAVRKRGEANTFAAGCRRRRRRLVHHREKVPDHHHRQEARPLAVAHKNTSALWRNVRNLQVEGTANPPRR